MFATVFTASKKSKKQKLLLLVLACFPVCGIRVSWLHTLNFLLQRIDTFKIKWFICMHAAHQHSTRANSSTGRNETWKWHLPLSLLPPTLLIWNETCADAAWYTANTWTRTLCNEYFGSTSGTFWTALSVYYANRTYHAHFAHLPQALPKYLRWEKTRVLVASLCDFFLLYSMFTYVPLVFSHQQKGLQRQFHWMSMTWPDFSLDFILVFLPPFCFLPPVEFVSQTS